ncbi:leucine-rich repeat domain-containing protein [Riemerella anatipestifer]|nr:leucine-rich repeat domain-containing protein [Riemerella anatipestifer]MDY3534123.1 leucine-rich repeat domain-containing protein [Riemerella anatipestifer]MDY3535754.1 leucine-rich repeat domain-containing protein [Riemerella anatipestifer]
MKTFLYFLFFAFYSFLNAQDIIASEKEVLVQIYQQTDGKNWNRTWDLSANPSEWFGVNIHNGSVAELRLNGNLLHGKLPSLTGLKNLKVLDLSSNHLSGDLSSINNLNQLELLDLSNNNFEGDISNQFTNLTQLHTLILGGNRLSLSTPDTFLNSFFNLKALDLSNFNLQGIPSKISSLNFIQELNLSSNPIKSGVSHLSKLKSLKKLDLSSIQMEVIPAEVSSLTQLISLNLSKNNLKENSINGIENLNLLEWLSLDQNHLSSIPPALGKLENLIHLNLSGNRIKEGLSFISSLSSLQYLNLSHNQIEGNVPSELLQLDKLMFLSLNGNQLTGELPNPLPPITDISNNRFTSAHIKNYLTHSSQIVDFTYSPQRYDEPVVIKTKIGASVNLTQSLESSQGYSFQWLKNLDTETNVSSENLRLNNITDKDFTLFTCEAYLSDKDIDISLFREPISIEDGELGIEEVSKSKISIHPNPTSDFINIHTTETDIDYTDIYDSSGKKLKTSHLKSIDLSYLPSGVYFISIKTKNKEIHLFKILKK